MRKPMLSHRTRAQPGRLLRLILVVVCTFIIAYLVPFPAPGPDSVARDALAQAPPGRLRLTDELGGIVGAPVADGDRGYAALHSRVVVIDAHAAPEDALLGTSAPLGTAIHTLAARDGIVVVGTNDLVVLDARDPQDIREVARAPLSHARTRASTWVGDQVWLQDTQSRILRFDLQRPARPQRLPDWSSIDDATGAVDSIQHVVAIGVERAAILFASASQPSTRTVAIHSIADDGSVTQLDASDGVGCCPIDMVYHEGELLFPLPDGNLRIIPVDDAGTLGAVRTDVLNLESVQVHAFGVVGAWYWFLNQHDNRLEFVHRARVDTPVGPLGVPGPAGFNRTVVSLGERVWATGGAHSLWLDPEHGVQPGPKLGISTLREVEPGPAGPWAVQWEGEVVEARRVSGSTWALRASPWSSHVDLAGVDTVRQAGSWLHRLTQSELLSAPVAEDGTIGSWTGADIPGALEGSTLRIADVRPGRVLALRTVYQVPEENIFVLRDLQVGVATPANVIRLGAQDIRVSSAVLDDSHIWLAGRSGLSFVIQALDISTLSQPSLVGTGVALRASSIVHTVFDDILVASTGNVLRLFDTIDKAAPRQRAELEMQGTVRRVARDGDSLAVVWNNTFEGGGGLSVVDLSRPDNPMVVAETDLGRSPFDVAIAADRIWVVGLALVGYVVDEPVAPSATPARATPTPIPTPTPTARAARASVVHLPWLGKPGE